MAYTESFPVCERLIHLNHAAVGPWPARTLEAVSRFAQENVRQGSLGYPRWLRVQQHLRDTIRNLINASSSDEIALVKNTSEGLSMIAAGLDWQHGDNIVGIRQEFPSNRVVWQSLEPQGVRFRQLDLAASIDPEQGLFGLCDERTRMIAVSAVQYADGFRLDLERIGRFCREQGILFCVDAIQHIGALPFDVQAIQADFTVADGHKWMLAPEGLGLFYVRRAVLSQLRPSQFGWHMMQPIDDYAQDHFEVARSARRYECGSPNMLGIMALVSSLEVLLEHGMQRVGSDLQTHVQRLIEGLQAIPGVELLTDTSPDRLSGIVTFRHPSLASKAIQQQLLQQDILCAERGGGVRLSPHYYLPPSHIDQSLQVIEDCLR
jgi:selenocysteine lyase/cysteine desulfurase